MRARNADDPPPVVANWHLAVDDQAVRSNSFGRRANSVDDWVPSVHHLFVPGHIRFCAILGPEVKVGSSDGVRFQSDMAVFQRAAVLHDEAALAVLHEKGDIRQQIEKLVKGLKIAYALKEAGLEVCGIHALKIHKNSSDVQAVSKENLILSVHSLNRLPDGLILKVARLAFAGLFHYGSYP